MMVSQKGKGEDGGRGFGMKKKWEERVGSRKGKVDIAGKEKKETGNGGQWSEKRKVQVDRAREENVT